jgi:hypothetical protein
MKPRSDSLRTDTHHAEPGPFAVGPFVFFEYPKLQTFKTCLPMLRGTWHRHPNVIFGYKRVIHS